MSDVRRPDRRTFLGIGLGAFAVAALPGVVRPDRRLVRRSVPVMGTVADFAVVSRNEDHAHRAIDAAVAELRRVESLMTRFRDDSDVGRANLTGALAPVPVSSETAAVVREALRWSRASGGVFDPALGRLIRRWSPAGDRREPGDEGRKALSGAPDLLHYRFQTRFEQLPEWEQSYLIAALERVAAILGAEDIDAAPVLDVGAIDKSV